MSTTISCPECDARMVVPDEVLGKKIRCKKCEAVVKTKAPVEDDDEPRKKASGRQPPKVDDERRAKRRPDDEEPRRRRARDEDDEDDDEDDDRPVRKSKKKKKNKNPIPYYIGLFVALVFAGGAIAFAMGAFDKPKGDKDRHVDEGEVAGIGSKPVVAIAHYDLSNLRAETVHNTDIIHVDYKATKQMKPELDYLIVTEFDGDFTTMEFRGDKQKGELLVNVPVGGWKPGSKIWLGRPQSTKPGAPPIRVSNIIEIS